MSANKPDTKQPAKQPETKKWPTLSDFTMKKNQKEQTSNAAAPAVEKKPFLTMPKFSFSKAKKDDLNSVTGDTDNTSSWSKFTHYVQSAAFRTIMWRVLLTVLIAAAALTIAALLINPASMPLALSGIIAGLGALALKAVFPAAVVVATASTIFLAQSFFAGRQAKQNNGLAQEKLAVVAQTDANKANNANQTDEQADTAINKGMNI